MLIITQRAPGGILYTALKIVLSSSKLIKFLCYIADLRSLGSRIWKVGFSGEPEPRAVFFSQDPDDKDSASEAWDLDMESVHGIDGSRSEGDRLIGVRIVQKLRETFIK